MAFEKLAQANAQRGRGASLTPASATATSRINPRQKGPLESIGMNVANTAANGVATKVLSPLTAPIAEAATTALAPVAEGITGVVAPLAGKVAGALGGGTAAAGTGAATAAATGAATAGAGGALAGAAPLLAAAGPVGLAIGGGLLASKLIGGK